MCVCACVYLNKIYFVRDYDFIYMIMDNLTMNWLWYPNQWGLFIGTLIPKPMGIIHWYSDTQPMRVIHWYSDTQTNGDYLLVLWYQDQWGLFIGTLIPKPMEVIHWYSDTQSMRLIHWYYDAQSQGYNVTIVIRLLRIWITFEYLTILSP